MFFVLISMNYCLVFSWKTQIIDGSYCTHPRKIHLSATHEIRIF